MDFEWDEAKNASNRAKHGVDFSLALEFDWSEAFVRPDSRLDYGEDRAVAYGKARDGLLYVIVFTWRGTMIRVISVRRFGRKDHLHYGKT
ncbi:hypothetical protein SAMN02983003_2534 [Devosia enhydra]|uniref:Uncharacterized protein n=1 Tax=Devosia enhydra TaxID=665118 RepID=A0A1K2HZ06_9HYPH|nr:BrnT family toxin [Devosia enhydra]SFZ85368.1 hypothetical protein SAMN02983003_2534 [Devosia enhydra]